MRAATARCLRDAFCGESMAHSRYLIYSEMAGIEEFQSFSRLFRAMALSKYVQASEKYLLVGELIGHHTASYESHFTFAKTMDNLEQSRNTESEEAKEVYAAFLAVAESQKEPGAEKSLRRSEEISRGLASLTNSIFLRAQRAAEEPLIGEVYVCQTCGMVVENSPPEQCPVCTGDTDGFVMIE